MVVLRLRLNLRRRSCKGFQSPSFFCRSLRYTTQRQMTLSSYLVTPKQLNTALQNNQSSNGEVIPLCASWFLPNDAQSRTGIASYTAQRIPEARFFDLDAVKDNSSPYPHMLPSAADFAAAMCDLGIGNKDTIVVYDTKELGIFSGPRVGWMLKVFGHDKVHILNNFRLWVEQGYPTQSGAPKAFPSKPYTVPTTDTSQNVVDFQQVKQFVKNKSQNSLPHASLLDARPKGRWDGRDPEPRPGLPSGHMPGSINIPFTDVLDPETKAFLPASQLEKLFEDKGVDPAGPIISSCGTGVSAVVLDTALTEAGYATGPTSRFVYDGSWTEWAQRVDRDEGLIVTSKE